MSPRSARAAQTPGRRPAIGVAALLIGSVAALGGPPVSATASTDVVTFAPTFAHATQLKQVAAIKTEGVPHASHVFVIVGENTSLRQLTSNHAPYIAGTLKAKPAWFIGYRAVANSSSPGDYIEMTSGQSIGCERNDCNPVNPDTDKAICHQKVNNIFNQLQRNHVSWRDWEESMPHACAFYDDGTDWAGDVYAAHHNPAIYYDNIEGNRYVEDFNKAPKGNAATTRSRWEQPRTTTPHGSTMPCHGSRPAVQLHRAQRL